MFRRFLRFCIFSLFLGSTFILPAQPIPCEEPPEMTSFCVDACIICDIDGFTGRHESDIVGEAPPGFAGECTFVAHNMQWIAFIAGSTDLSVSLEVSNCAQGLGLEFGLYKGIDCENFERISNCFGGAAGIIGPGQSGTIVNNEPLVIGQYYFIVMDGGLGDNCDWTFNVLDGSTQVAPLTSSGLIEGPATSCPSTTTSYWTDGQEGATEFLWTLDGTTISEEQETAIDWTADGVYNLCVTISNACDEAPPSCRTIIIESIPPTIINESLCDGDCFEVADTILCDGGSYNYNFTTAEGCDSLVLVNIDIIPAAETNLDLLICDGDSIFIGNAPFFEMGNYSQVLTTFQACDSTVNLNLDVIICLIQGATIPDSVDCFGESSGALGFEITDGTPPYTYQWQRIDGSLSGMGNITNNNELNTLNNLSEGTYLITVTDNFGNNTILIEEIYHPNTLLLNSNISDFNGTNVSCSDATDGFIELIPMGGTLPYSYLWNTNEETPTINNLSPGNYSVQITDANGCDHFEAFELDAPDPIMADVFFTNSSCEGLETGSIIVQSTTGGAPDYLFDLTGAGFTNQTEFNNLSPGNYSLTVSDANGCTTFIDGTLIAPIIPDIDLGENLSINLGDSIDLDAFSNITPETILWTPSQGLSCLDCLNPNVRPFVNATYFLSVSSIDGCVTTDSISIEVIEVRNVFVPNAFSPNQDGYNDRFTIFAGPEVSEIKSFNVFNRWGAQLYSQKNFPPNEERLGWDGTFRGKEMDIGVYTWYAEVLFVDEITKIYEGSISLLK